MFKNFFQNYRTRKICLLIIILLTLFSLIIYPLFYNTIINFSKTEIEFWGSKTEAVKSTSQIIIFQYAWAILYLLWLFILALSIWALFNLIKERSNSVVLMRIILLTSILSIITIALLLSFQLQSVEDDFYDEAKDELIIRRLPSPNYWAGWVLLFSSITIFASSILARRSYGYLNNDKRIIKTI